MAFTRLVGSVEWMTRRKDAIIRHEQLSAPAYDAPDKKGFAAVRRELWSAA